MPDVSSHAPGTFSWSELATVDQAGGKAFYSALFGWAISDQAIGPDMTYTTFQLRGRAAAAAYSMRPEEIAAGPPHWNMYVAVASADDSARRAQELGGTIVAPPFDVMDYGRMAILQDPTGAVFEVWQARTHIGAQVLNEPGGLCWSELTTTNTKAALAFYTGLFGWRAKESAPAAAKEYTEFTVHGADRPSVGMLPMPDMGGPMPSFWMPYFQVTDCDASVARAAELGGSVMRAAEDIPHTGRFAILRDPQGAMFAVFTFASH